MADKRISQLVDRGTVANNDVVPIVVSGAVTTNKATISSIQTFMQGNLDLGVTSVGLSMPSAFAVSNSPVTTSGNISVTGAGTVSQYIRGDGSLADFPQGGGGGGASVNYYLNGSVSQGTIGGIAYREMNKTPIFGAGTDISINTNGYIASFITDAGDPNLLLIPAGNWNFETYFSASSAGGSPSFYVELYKVDLAGTATLIASNSNAPELIAFGTNLNPYFSALAVPSTTLLITDRLALRYYVTHSGRTITLHTENGHLCQIITTFTTGLTALNGLTAQVQNFTTGTSGTDFAISSTSATHTFNLPDASATARGVVTTGTQTFAGYKIFTGTIGVNQDIQLVTKGTALNTFITNINATGLTSIGSNGFGFNNANNIYFSGSNKGGGVLAFSNTGTQIYTLQDASGTLAFTSDISTALAGYVTLATAQTITGQKTFTTSGGSDSVIISTSGNGFALDAIKAGNGPVIRVNKTSGTGNAMTVIGGNFEAPTIVKTGGTSSQFLMADGSVNTSVLASGAYLPLVGGTLTGALRVENNAITQDGSRPILTLQQSGTTKVILAISTGLNDLVNGDVSGDAVFRKPASSGAFRFSVDGGISSALVLASTGAGAFSGALTLGGALNGTSAVFSISTNAVTDVLSIRNTNAGTSSVARFNIGNNISPNAFTIKTFSSTHSTKPFISQILNEFNANLELGGFGETALSLGSGGAATFSSSVTALNAIFKNQGSSPNNTLFIQTSDYAGGSVGSVLRLGHVATTGNSTAIIQNLTAGGTTAGNISFPEGNVGIGTATPSRPLDVNGSARANSFASTTGRLAVPSATFTTFFTPSVSGLYLARVYLSGNNSQFWSAVIIFEFNASSILLVNQTNGINVSTNVSGTNIQVRQIGGTTFDFDFEIIRIG